jgi:hypothetical protein
MKSLIQNSLKLGEKPQTTEASIFKIQERKKDLPFSFFLIYIIHDFQPNINKKMQSNP